MLGFETGMQSALARFIPPVLSLSDQSIDMQATTVLIESTKLLLSILLDTSESQGWVSIPILGLIRYDTWPIKHY